MTNKYAATTPQRIQLRRTRGWRKPEAAIVVSRPTKWGNPFTIDDAIESGFAADRDQARRLCVEAFRSCLVHGRGSGWWSETAAHRFEWMTDHLESLAGRDLACWCTLVDPGCDPVPCHADVLLELANSPYLPHQSH